MLAKVSKYQLEFLHTQLYRTLIKKYEGKKVEVQIEPYTGNKSLQQLRYIYLILNLLSEHTGSTVGELKAIFKYELGLIKYVSKVPVYKSLKLNGQDSMSKQERSLFLEHILKQCGEQDIKVMSSEEYYET